MGEKRDGNARGLTIALLAAAFVCVVACVLVFGGGDGGQDEGDAVGAYVICKDFVRDRLRAPRSARFPSVSRADVDELAGNSWKVRAWVDAENAFGAEVRAEWECVVVYAGDDEWRLERLEIDE